ncbi:hypothetical protein TSAR_008282 [Trichomalopsis sarcophagae]|uniref:Uncharacterized protein n=1 Tax=Trichomalopsis sarcophagae TaxID=543379 RepID=A0A232FMM8_9HYME|nr:hypothetical protein TSAR_008282 [Trichomalopsis sarcophagae]
MRLFLPILFLKKRYVTANVNNNAAKQKNAVNINERKYSFVTRGFLAILPEVPGAQGWQYQHRLLEYLMSRVDSINIISWDYLKYRTISMLSGPRNPMSLILFTVGTRYLGERCRHDILILRPQKPPSNKTGLISINIYGVLIYCLFCCTLHRL